jgi:hypothetical protein
MSLQCNAPGSSTVRNEALLVASTGQEVAASAVIVKRCYELTVRLGDIAPPSIAK